MKTPLLCKEAYVFLSSNELDIVLVISKSDGPKTNEETVMQLNQLSILIEGNSK